MSDADLRPSDIAQLTAHGISPAEAERQLGVFANPPGPLHLERACSLGDGILALGPSEQRECLEAYDAARAGRHITKFVPASGAASRMFQTLLAVRSAQPVPALTDLATAPPSGDARDAAQFFRDLRRFAFFETLRQATGRNGIDIDAELAAGRIDRILAALLDSSQLGCAALPKALIPFHAGPDGVRTAFDEHLAEGAGYAAQADGTCRLHFTVSPAHVDAFQRRLDTVRASYESRYRVCYEVGFSTQKAATDTLAVDPDNRPFRLADGTLLLRAGGHGALIENLNDLGGDIVFLKNIDNVAAEHLLPDTLHWKKVLAGHLCRTQARLFACIQALRSGAATPALQEALRFAQKDLCLGFAADVAATSPESLRALLLQRLDRPVRVCGMVRNTGEPGGGPFWVRGSDGTLSLQVVERAQTDAVSAEQQRIFAAATHFSPVDFVCGVRNARGQAFDLTRYVDPSAVFIAEKSAEGRRLKALERPGLWNGGMAGWITLFVEVPISTFNPVKTVLDLLRPAHQPG